MSETTVLVPLDGSRFSEQALPIALGLARMLDASVELATVAVGRAPAVPIGDAWASPEALTAATEAASDYLSEVGHRVAEVTNIPLKGELLLPSPTGESVGHVLVDHIEKSAPVLVVMSTHGRGPLSRAWMGSVASHVVHHTTVALLLVRPEGESEVAINDSHRFRHILVPLDGSEQAESSLPWARGLGQASGASCTLVRVVPRSYPAWSPYVRTPDPDIRDFAELGHDEATAYLHGVEQGLKDEGLVVESVVDDADTAAHGILHQAEERSADLITITTHGRSAIPRLILGSVADKVVRASHVPVLVVRHRVESERSGH
jgi:nucleotide-binding universal stress UspA family protein